LTHEVEDALNRDDYRTACLKADEGLARFPEERNLLKLKALADRQRQLEERKQFIDEQLAVARKHLLEAATKNCKRSWKRRSPKSEPSRASNPCWRLSERTCNGNARSGRKSEVPAESQGIPAQPAFDDAVHTLEAMAKEMDNDAEIQDLLTRARTEKAGRGAGRSLGAPNRSRFSTWRVNILQEALRKSPQEGELNEQLPQCAGFEPIHLNVAGEAKKLEEARQYDQALTKWESRFVPLIGTTPASRTPSSGVRGLRDRAHTDARQGWIEGIRSFAQHLRLPAGLDAARAEQSRNSVGFRPDGTARESRSWRATRTKAQKPAGGGRKSFANQQWEVGAEIMLRAHQLAPGISSSGTKPSAN